MKQNFVLVLVGITALILAGCGLLEMALETQREPTVATPTTSLAEMHFYAGLAKAKAGEYEPAIQDFNQAIELEPRSADAYYNRGLTYAQLGKWDKAITDYTTTLELDPDSADAYANRGWVHAHLGDHDRAIRDFSQAIALAPEVAGTYYFRSQAYVACGDYERAIFDLERYLELEPAAFGREEMLIFIEHLQQVVAGAGILLPGETLASPELQLDVLNLVLQFEAASGPACEDLRVSQTELVEVVTEFQFEQDKFVAGSWLERWTVNRCGTPVNYLITNVADGQGGTYFVVQPEPDQPQSDADSGV